MYPSPESFKSGAYITEIIIDGAVATKFELGLRRLYRLRPLPSTVSSCRHCLENMAIGLLDEFLS